MSDTILYYTNTVYLRLLANNPRRFEYIIHDILIQNMGIYNWEIINNKLNFADINTGVLLIIIKYALYNLQNTKLLIMKIQ
jgi:hypothetical protein